MVIRLQATRGIRALGQGALIVAFSLYLIDLGWKPAAVGALFTASGLLTAAGGWLAGIASDRLGRRIFLLAYQAVRVVLALALALFESSLLLAASCLILGFGRMQSGRPGIMAAAEQAWLSQGSTARRRGMLFSTNAALGFLGMGIGSLTTALIPLIRHVLPGLLAYRPFFLLVGVGAAVNLFLLWGAADSSRAGRRMDDAPPENRLAPRQSGKVQETSSGGIDGRACGAGSDEEVTVRRRENVAMLKLVLVNAINGIAIGLTSPLLVYWFSLRYGVGPAAIGPVYGFTFLLTAASSLWTGKLTERFGIVKAVVAVRLAAVVLLVLMPLMPTFTLAAIAHILRSAIGRGSVGARQALAMNLVRDRRRGLAGGIYNISMTLPNSAAPAISGLMLEAGRLNLPFMLAAGLQLLYAVLFGVVFRRHDAPTTR
jgi:MFS family permease